MTVRGEKGSALLEAAILAPLVLGILAGGYAAWRTSVLSSRAASVAREASLRAGRGLPADREKLEESVLPGRSGVVVRSGTGKVGGPLPLPVPPLAGRSWGEATLKKTWEESGAFGPIEPLILRRRVDMSVDTWSAPSSSGRNIKRLVRARVLSSLAGGGR